MSMSVQLAACLPYLRRYARALTGSQTSGDAYVGEALETIVADPASLEPQRPPRIALYRLFTRLWNALPVDDRPDAVTDASDLAAADRRLATIPPRARQAFLLVSQEGFSSKEAAQILECGIEEVEQLLAIAGREIAEQVSTEVMIIEDEPLIAMNLEELVTSLGHRVRAVARTHREALQAAARGIPGIVLADIQLADGSSGIAAVNDLLRSFSVPVVFITAYPERLLTGQRPEPAFLITKPFAPDVVKVVISQALFFDQNSRPPALANTG